MKSDVKFTPWKKRKKGIHFSIESAETVIAEVRFVRRPDGSTSEDEADLIASAPTLLAVNAQLKSERDELLEALEALYEANHGGNGFNEFQKRFGFEMNKARDVAAALIQKARGAK